MSEFEQTIPRATDYYVGVLARELIALRMEMDRDTEARREIAKQQARPYQEDGELAVGASGHCVPCDFKAERNHELRQRAEAAERERDEFKRLAYDDLDPTRTVRSKLVECRHWGNDLARERDAARAAVERLTRALEKIADREQMRLSGDDGWAMPPQWYSLVALDALSPLIADALKETP